MSDFCYTIPPYTYSKILLIIHRNKQTVYTELYSISFMSKLFHVTIIEYNRGIFIEMLDMSLDLANWLINIHIKLSWNNDLIVLFTSKKCAKENEYCLICYMNNTIPRSITDIVHIISDNYLNNHHLTVFGIYFKLKHTLSLWVIVSILFLTHRWIYLLRHFLKAK